MKSPRKLVLAAAVLLLATAAILSWPGPRASSPAREDARAAPAAAKRASRGDPPVQDLPAPVVCPHLTGTAEHRDWLQSRGEALMDLSWMDDRASLDTILAELANPDVEIRRAALAATLNFGSRDAIPRLQSAALAAEDPQEKQQLEKAVEHLKLPTLREVLAKKRASAAKAAR